MRFITDPSTLNGYGIAVRRFIVAFLLAMLPISAFAADLSLKAPASTNPLFTGYPYNGSGFYWGIGSMVSGESPTINGTVATSLEAFGGSLGGIVGYQWGHGSVAYAVEAGAYWQNLGGASICTADAVCRVNSNFELVQKAKAMTPLSNLTSLLPAFGNVAQPAFPVLPAGITIQTMHAYIMVTLHESDISSSIGAATAREWQVRPGFGVGTIAQLSNSAALDVFAEYLPPTGAFNVGTVGGTMTANTGAKYVVGTSILW
jgi:hypothetical protein